jgi:glycosyltransferase involved in cell wall biosynthesis
VLSVVLPVYNERENLAPVLAELRAVLRDTPHEIIAVDDGSTDGSLDELRAIGAAGPRLRVLALERRAGQSAATLAGIDAAGGDVVITMDADGQNDPADLPTLVAALGRDDSRVAAIGYRARRADHPWKRLQSRIANVVRNWITGDTIRDTGCGLKAMRRGALVRLPRFDGMHRFLPTLLRMQGGVVVEVPVAHRPRLHGRSKYGMWDRALRGLRDALGVRWLSRRPLNYTVREDPSNQCHAARA